MNIVNIKLTSVFFLILFLSSLFLTRETYAATLFIDNFDDGNSTGWIVPRNTCSSSWIVSAGTYGISPNGCITESIPEQLIIDLGSNYSFEVDMTMPTSLNDRNFVFKYKDSNNWYGIHTYQGSAYVQKVVDGQEYFLENRQFNYPFVIGGTYHFKIDVINDTRYDVYINGVLQTTAVDNSPFFINYSAGLQASGTGQVWFDNVVVTEILSATPTPTPLPPPPPTSQPTVGPFELPFNYEGRPATESATFANMFWNKATSLFDHSFLADIFTPFTGVSVSSNTTPCTNSLNCYDSHNGTDFSKPISDGYAYSVGNGQVVYTSKPEDECSNDTVGYGCSVIVRYTGSLYTLYAHLNNIAVTEGQNVDINTQIGVIGQSGSATGDHLHFGVLKPVNDKLTSANVQFMKNKDWNYLLTQISNSTNLPRFKAYCTFNAPNGVSFSFSDPSGWAGEYKDPWSMPKNKDGCNINSRYLWKYSIL